MPSTWTCPSFRRPPWTWNTLKMPPWAPPTSLPWTLMAGTSAIRPPYCLDVGIEDTVSPLITSWVRALVTSTVGASPETVIVSATWPIFISALIVAMKLPVNSTPSRLTTLNPVSVNVTVYAPGLRLSMEYWPRPSVTTVRVFSMSAGLDASTTTPGRTAPEASLAVPTIDAVACANNARGMARRDTRTTTVFTLLNMVTSAQTALVLHREDEP